MKNKHLYILTVCVLLVAFVLGATGAIDLAATQNNEGKTIGDKLIGVMVTKESLNLFDFEQYFNDHAKDFISGNTDIADTTGYEQRIYAELTETASSNEATGETVHTKEYIFPDIDGFYLYGATVHDTHGDYVTHNASNALSDIKSSSHYKDNGEEQTLETTLYTTYDSDIYTVYANPVYQTENGEVYLVAGTGIAGQGGLTQTLTESVTYTKDGEDYTYSAAIIFHRETIHTPQTITVTQMDGENQVLLTDTYRAGQLPEKIIPQENTAYLLVTTSSLDEYGKLIEERTLYQPSDEFMETFFAQADGICEKQQTEIIWSAKSIVSA